MQRTSMHDARSGAFVDDEPQVIASLSVSSATQGIETPASRRSQSRPVIHLARTAHGSGTPGDNEAAYALGLSISGEVAWNVVGHLDLDSSAVERVLLAGLSVLALEHVRAAEVQIGDAVLVYGADPWSLLLLQWAKLQGASPLVFASHGPLSECVATLGVDASLANPAPPDLARAVKLTHRAGGFAVAFDAIANEQTITQALAALRDGGRYVLAGLEPQPSVMLNAYPDLHRRDLEIISPMHSPFVADFAEMFRFSLNLADQGRLRLDGLLDQALGWRARVTRHAS